MIYDEHQQLTTNFNGTYSLGGTRRCWSEGPVRADETITGEQYRRALLDCGDADGLERYGTPRWFMQDALFFAGRLERWARGACRLWAAVLLAEQIRRC